MARQRVDVNQAADILGISTDAVRKRARRGTLPSEKDADGHLYIWLDGGTPDSSTPTQAHLDSLQEQIEFLRRELERKDTILLNMTEAMRALNPPASSEVSESPETVSELADSDDYHQSCRSLPLSAPGGARYWGRGGQRRAYPRGDAGEPP
jgi:hypothetical protein